MQRSRSWARTAALGVLSTALIAGCGSSSKSSSSGSGGGGGSSSSTAQANPVALIQGTVDKARAAKDADVTLNMHLTVNGQTENITGNGVESFDPVGAHLNINVPNEGAIEEVITSTAAYIKLPPQAASQAGKPWGSIQFSELSTLTGNAAASLQAFRNSDPSQYLSQLVSVSNDVQNLGSADVNGTQTTHYRANVDVAKAAQKEGNPQAAQVFQQEFGTTTFPEDVYIDSDGLARRVTFNLTPAPGASAAAAQISVGGTIDLSNYGKANTSSIQPPPADQTVDFVQLLKQSGGGD